MFGRDRGEIFRRVLQLHGVSFFLFEIDQDLVEEEIPIGHPAKAPALVQTKTAGLELIELLGIGGRELS